MISKEYEKCSALIKELVQSIVGSGRSSIQTNRIRDELEYQWYEIDSMEELSLLNKELDEASKQIKGNEQE